MTHKMAGEIVVAMIIVLRRKYILQINGCVMSHACYTTQEFAQDGGGEKEADGL